jgi:DNA gyrase/topoisomerase IV subunit A
MLTERVGVLAGAFPITKDQDVLVIANDGVVIRVPATQVRKAGRATQGVRVMRLEKGRSVAAVVYRQRDYIVDAFVWPTADKDAPIATTSLRGFNVSHWSRGGMRYCVVSDLPRAPLVKFALAFESSRDTL